MEHRLITARHLLLPAVTLVGAALLFLGTRHHPAAASCSQQPANAPASQSAPVSLTSNPDKSTLGPCPAQDTVDAAASPPSDGLTGSKLAAAFAASLGQTGGQTSVTTATPASGISPTAGMPALLRALAPPSTSASGFVWPVMGPITQPFGVPELGVGAPHTGIDVGVGSGTPVRAAQSGRVVFAGGDPCCSLGYWIEINHGNRYATRYGHLMRPPLVLSGDYITQGQIIGFSGNTGFSTGPHVHFEIRLDGNPIDPLRLLPRQAAGTNSLGANHP